MDRPRKTPLPQYLQHGSGVRLEALTGEHLEALCEAGLDADLWRSTAIQVTDRTGMQRYLENAIEDAQRGTAQAYAIRALPAGPVIGSTRFHSWSPVHRRIEIGFTWLARAYHRTHVNAACKLMMLEHAFEQLDCRRVQFTAAADNVRSRAALLALGAREEGTLRSYLYSEARGQLDAVIFSVTAAEWPDIETRLRERARPRSEETPRKK